MADRYFVQTPIRGPRAVLSGAEAHHLVAVMRAGPGEEITLFDGSGAEFLARVLATGRGRVELDVLARCEVDRELPAEVTLAVALPKGDRQKWLVEKAVELGVARLVPLLTARSLIRPGPSSLQRLGRQVIEASKQCGRNRLMEIAPPLAWPDLLATTAQTPLRIVAHPRGGRPPVVRHTKNVGLGATAGLSSSAGNTVGQANRGTSQSSYVGLLCEAVAGPMPTAVLAAIGPEGGLTEEEFHLALAAGWQPIDLGPRVLRIETAALAVAAWLSVAR